MKYRCLLFRCVFCKLSVLHPIYSIPTLDRNNVLTLQQMLLIVGTKAHRSLWKFG